MKSFRANIGLFALIFFLWLCTSAGQITKYLHARAPLLFLAGAVCIAIVLFITRAIENRTTQISAWWLVLFWVLAAIAYFVVYPITQRHIFGPGSDSENAMLTAATELLHGHFPYYKRTFLNTPITPMPGSLLLSLPFLFLGRVSYQALFWLAIFVLFCARFFEFRITALAFLLVTILGSAGILNELVAGVDYTFNALYIAIAIWWIVRAHQSGSAWQCWLAAVFLGIALSSRVIYVVIPPIVFAWLTQRHGLSAAIRTVAVSVVVALGLTLPFYLHDPAHFTPLNVNGKLAFLSPSLQRIAQTVCPALAMLIACTAFFQRLTLPRLFLLAGLATGAILFPATILFLFYDRFLLPSQLLLEYVTPTAIYVSLWAFSRFEALNLSASPLPETTAQPVG